jgi:hypothetical protein
MSSSTYKNEATLIKKVSRHSLMCFFHRFMSCNNTFDDDEVGFAKIDTKEFSNEKSFKIAFSGRKLNYIFLESHFISAKRPLSKLLLGN